MARERIGSDLMQVRFPDGTFERIDALSLNRSGFIRAAVAAALGGGSVSVEKKSDGVSAREADKLAVLDYARDRRATSREVGDAMGWLGLRYSKAEADLLSEGRIIFVEGVMVCI